jgi:hypothetical protein
MFINPKTTPTIPQKKLFGINKSIQNNTDNISKEAELWKQRTDKDFGNHCITGKLRQLQ